MKNTDDEVLFKLVKYHLNKSYHERKDTIIHGGTGLTQPAQWYRDFAKAVIAEAVVAEREACAQVCDEKASKMEQEAQAAEADKEDATSLRSSAWLISVCASSIRARAAIAAAKENT